MSMHYDQIFKKKTKKKKRMMQALRVNKINDP